MLSSDWLQNFQYNHNEPDYGRLLYIRKDWLLTVHQFVQAGFVCLFGLNAVIHFLFDRGLRMAWAGLNLKEIHIQKLKGVLHPGIVRASSALTKTT